MDDNAAALTQLERHKSEKEALSLTKEIAKKAKVEAEAIVIAFLWTRATSKRYINRSRPSLIKQKDVVFDLQVKATTVIGEQNCLADNLQQAKEAKDTVEEGSLYRWLPVRPRWSISTIWHSS